MLSLIDVAKTSFLLFCFFQELENALNEFGQKWELNPGDGAFYGPKVTRQYQFVYELVNYIFMKLCE